LQGSLSNLFAGAMDAEKWVEKLNNFLKTEGELTNDENLHMFNLL
jgi:hypothetical protein